MSEVLPERTELAGLQRTAEELAQVIETDAPHLANDANALVSKTRAGRFEVAIVGEFNRGKSTLLNALVHRSVLPSGVLPVTAIPTQISLGEHEQAVVHFNDGNEEVIDLTRLEEFVTEEMNPGNNRSVDNVSVTLPGADVLRSGAVLIDTPGVNSIFRSSNETRELLLSADGAVMVFSAVSPITDAERSMLKLLRKRAARTFFVLNRVDLISPEELDRVQWFVDNILTEMYGEPQELFLVSAATGQGVEEFAKAFDDFLEGGLDAARRDLIRQDLLAVIERLENDTALEASALDLNYADLDDRLSRFRRAVDWQQESFDDDVVLFGNAVDRVIASVDEAKMDTVIGGRDERNAKLTAASEDVELANLASVLDAAVAEEINQAVARIHMELDDVVEPQWERAAERFERASQRRVDKLREVAGDLFQVELHPIAIPRADARMEEKAEVPSLENVASTGLWTRMFAKRRSHEQVLAAAETRVQEEIERQGTLIRTRLKQRLVEARAEMERSMQGQVEEVSNAVERAMQKGQAAQASNEEERRTFRERNARLNRTAQVVRNKVTAS